MASKRLRAWFFETPELPTYGRFSRFNKPTRETFEDLMASVPFFEEEDSRGSQTMHGLVRMATGQEVLQRAAVAAASAPGQLPEVKAGVGMAVGLDAQVTTHQAFVVDFDPDTLEIQGAEAIDYLVGVFAGVPKKIALGSVSGTNFLVKQGTVVRLEEEGDELVASGNITARHFLLTGAQGVGRIKPVSSPDGEGVDLSVCGGGSVSESNHDGGNLFVHGGTPSGTGDYGDSFVAFDGNAARGMVGIRGGKDTAGIYQTKVHDNVWITGKLKVGVSAGNLLVTNQDGELAASVVTLAELAALSGVSGNLQAQINALAQRIGNLEV